MRRNHSNGVHRAHSFTLAAATLGFVNVAGPPIEAAIALSIVLVAGEIVPGYDSGRTERDLRRAFTARFRKLQPNEKFEE